LYNFNFQANYSYLTRDYDIEIKEDPCLEIDGKRCALPVYYYDLFKEKLEEVGEFVERVCEILEVQLEVWEMWKFILEYIIPKKFRETWKNAILEANF
jgi:hypothetical protein